MTKEAFKILLEDLYSIYNPAKLSEIDNVLNNNIGKEFDALKMFFFKYNFRGSTKHNPKLGTDSHIKSLLQNYSEGQRTLLNTEQIQEIDQNKLLLDKTIEETKEQLNTFAEENKKEINEELNKKIQENLKNIEEYFNKKKEEIETKEKELSGLIEKNIGYIKTIEEKIEALNLPVEIKTEITNQEEGQEKIELKITINNNDESFIEFEIPKGIDKMALGSRMIITDVKGGICGLEIKDIMYDYVSSPGNCFKEITLERI